MNLNNTRRLFGTINKAIQLSPNVAGFYHTKGEILQNMGRDKESQAAFKKAKELGYKG